MSERTRALEEGQLDIFDQAIDQPKVEVPLFDGDIVARDVRPNSTAPTIEWHPAVNDGETLLDDLEIAKRHLATLHVLGALSRGKKLLEHRGQKVDYDDFRAAHARTIGTEEFIAQGLGTRRWAEEVRQNKQRHMYERRFADDGNFDARTEEIARTKAFIAAHKNPTK